MARELVTRQGVGEQAGEIWRSLQVQYQETSPPTNGVVLPTPEPNVIKEMDADERPRWIESASLAVQFSLF